MALVPLLIPSPDTAPTLTNEDVRNAINAISDAFDSGDNHHDVLGTREIYATVSSTSDNDQFFAFPDGLVMGNSEYNLQVTANNATVTGDLVAFGRYTKDTGGFTINRDDNITGTVSLDYRVIGVKP